jgi:hypothetical protein
MVKEAEPAGNEDPRSFRDASNLGYFLSQARGFRVVARDGHMLGILESLRYGLHADYPDELIVRRRRFPRKRMISIPFDAVLSVAIRNREVHVRQTG